MSAPLREWRTLHRKHGAISGRCCERSDTVCACSWYRSSLFLRGTAARLPGEGFRREDDVFCRVVEVEDV